MFRSRQVMLVLVLLLGILPGGLFTTTTVTAQTDRRCFNETGFCIEGRIREFWEQNGGLPVFGFPISAQGEQDIEGKRLVVQNFERNRLELHPENARPYDVLLGRLGAVRLEQQGRDWQSAFPKGGALPGCRFFPETGHSVCGEILNAWRANGLELDGRAGKTEAENLALFGLPLSGLVLETLSDGRQYQVQWFERARFELHPENQPPFNVLLGLLGNETRNGSGTVTPPPAADPCADVQQPRNGRIRPSRCVDVGTVLSIDVFGFQPNEQIGFWLNSPDGLIVGTIQTLSIGPTGAVDNLPFQTAGLQSGIWFLVFEGVTSKHQSVIYFKINPAQGGGSTGGGAIPPSQNATVTPTSGGRGTIFIASASGFTPDEMIGVYVTAPDGSVFGAPFQVQANAQGVSQEVFFRTVNDPSFPTGIWAITFEGVTSKRKGIAYFEIRP